MHYRTRLTFRSAMATLLCTLFAAAVITVAPGCTNDESGTVRVVATTGMIGDTIREVAGEAVDVHVLMGPGVDPHLYRPTRRDMRAMLDADAVFANGHDLEGRMGQTFRDVREAGKPVVFVAEELDEDALLRPAEFEGAFDPHVWMDPGRWQDVTTIIADALADLDPASASAYETNASAYVEQLDDLDAYAREAFETIPENRRVLVTAHDAFHYLADAYGVDVLGIQGISTDSEAGLRRIEQLVDRLVDDDIPVVFAETSVADKHVRSLIDGARARDHDVRIGGTLFSDAMGSAGTYEGTYIGMIDHNVTTIVRGLGGQAPARGMNGQLEEPDGDDT